VCKSGQNFQCLRTSIIKSSPKKVRSGAIQAQSKIEILLIINRGEAQHGQLSVEESISVNSRQIDRVAERWKFVAVCDFIGAPICTS